MARTSSRSPKQAERVTLTIRIPADLHEHVVAAAEDDDRSVNSFVTKLLTDRVAPKGTKS